MKNSKPLRLSVGVAIAARSGGIPAAEYPLLSELKRIDQIDVKTFDFGSRSDHEGFLYRIRQRLNDVKDFISHCRDFKPDLVQLNSSYDKRAMIRDLVFCIVSRIMRVRLLIKMHGSDLELLDRRQPLWNFVTKLISRQAVGIAVLSREQLQALLSAGVHERKLHLVRNAVEVSCFGKGIHCHNSRAFLFIGRFVPSKGILDVIRAFRNVLRSDPCARLTLVGDGPQRRQAESLVCECGIESKVRFTGLIPENEARSLYETASILLHPSQTEGFPMAVFQAAAAGLAIITTPVGAAADFFREPDNCLWVQPQSSDQLSAKLEYLIKHPELICVMAKNNKSLAQRFSPETVASEYFALYQKLLCVDA